MAKRIRYTPEQIITKLREAEVYLSQGKTIGQACKTLEISDQTYYRWRREYGGMDVTQARKLKEMEKENTWLKEVQIKPLFIEPGSPWENGYIDPFNGKMRDELLNGEIFYTLKEARVLIEMWRKEYNTIRPHSALGYCPPVPAAIMVPTTQFYQLALT